MRLAVSLVLALIVSILWGSALAAAPAPAVAPSIQSLLKPAVFARVIQDRQIMTHASLDDDGKGAQRYTYYAAMIVQANVRQTRAVLTNYALYAKMISYIKVAKYDPVSHVLELSGGIFGWGLRSWVQFEEMGENRIHYKIIRGNFTGMAGDILFERQGQPGRPTNTLVYMGGELTQTKWPPKLIIERGAEIVFGFTAKRMRSYINDQASR